MATGAAGGNRPLAAHVEGGCAPLGAIWAGTPGGAGRCPSARARIAPRYANPEAFARVPFNPCHYLWRELVEGMGYPYLKTELIRRNPGKLPGVENWREVVPPAELQIIEEHLAAMGP